MFIFDGKKKAEEIRAVSRIRNLESSKKGVTPTMVSIVVGDESGALKYQEMKKKAAERVGANLQIFNFQFSTPFDEIKNKITEWNGDPGISGIMIQLPLPEDLRHKTKDLINAIAREKDVDGMRPARAGGDDSPFVAPVVMAVEIALDEASEVLGKDLKVMKTLVVGSSGFVGQKLVRHLSQKGYVVVGVDEGEFLDPYTRSADVIISATGVENLIGPDQINEGVVLIDVGSPKGDIAKEAYNKAAFVSPVPGGIGPVTIACLVQNLIFDK